MSAMRKLSLPPSRRYQFAPAPLWLCGNLPPAPEAEGKCSRRLAGNEIFSLQASHLYLKCSISAWSGESRVVGWWGGGEHEVDPVAGCGELHRLRLELCGVAFFDLFDFWDSRLARGLKI